jgi:hypothetical protein
MYLGLNVQFLKQIRTFKQNLIKVSSTKFHENSSTMSRADTCGQTEVHAVRQTDRHMKKLKSAFREYANVHMNGFVYSTEIQKTQVVHYIHYWGFEYDGLIARRGIIRQTNDNVPIHGRVNINGE